MMIKVYDKPKRVSPGVLANTCPSIVTVTADDCYTSILLSLADHVGLLRRASKAVPPTVFVFMDASFSPDYTCSSNTNHL